METDSPASENPADQVIWTANDQGPSHARSYYECTFCKKGFSNAQALGGHMNIHRRDRARLKHPSNDAEPALDTTKRDPNAQPALDTTKRDPNPLFAPISADQDRPLESLRDHDHGSTSIKWPWALSTEGGIHKGELQQLPLFVDTPNTTGGDDHRLVGHGRDEDGRIEDSHDPGQEELDLELRLGPEPQDMPLAGHKKSP